jgi:hypothetical protein
MVRPATPADTPAIARLIRALAEYERLSHQVTLQEDFAHRCSLHGLLLAG